MIRFAYLLALLALAGCSIERHTLSNPGVSQAVRVESGDRLFFELEEQPGTRWDYICRDHDDNVEVVIDRAERKAKVMIRIHRGYDGPSAVNFFLRRNGAKTRSFTITLFKRTGDCAFWE